VPGPTPIPRGPTVLTLYGASDLLTGPGCPVCRYAEEAADRYLAWFALEGHADTVTITRLCSSLGMCPRHTRGLMSQPGAAGRLTAVYRYVMAAARDRLSGRAGRLGRCPGCEHDDGAADRALERPGSGVCLACLAAGHAEQSHLDRIGRVSDHSPDRRLLLCAGHLADLAILTGRQDVAPMLAWQAGCLAASLNRVDGIGRLWSRRYRADGSQGCPVYLAAEHAAQRALEDFRVSVRGSQPAPGWLAPLCVQHLLGLRAVDRRAAGAAAPPAAERAGTLIAELNEAFGKGTWARRHEARGPEVTAWRRAAAFLNGGVFCGCPPHEPGAD
jgi:hypothetical protein